MSNVRRLRRDPVPELELRVGSADLSQPGHQPDFQLADVISGRYDSQIRHFADGAAEMGPPVLPPLQLGDERRLVPLGRSAPTATRPTEYATAWRHVHDIFTAVGATNATWVWCPYVDLTGKQNLRVLSSRARVRRLDLPGRLQLGARQPRQPETMEELREIFRSDLPPGRDADRPSQADDPRRDRFKPLRRLEGRLDSQDARRPARLATARVRGFIWFDVNDRAAGWPIEVWPPAITAFRNGIGNRAYLPNRVRRHLGPPDPAPPVEAGAPRRQPAIVGPSASAGDILRCLGAAPRGDRGAPIGSRPPAATSAVTHRRSCAGPANRRGMCSGCSHRGPALDS